MFQLKTRKTLSFEWQVGLSVSLAALILLLIGILSYFSLSNIVDLNNLLEDDYNLELVEMERLRYDSEALIASSRSYLASGKEERLRRMEAANGSFNTRAQRLTETIADTSELQLLKRIVSAHQEHLQAVENAVRMKKEGERERLRLFVDTTLAHLRHEYEINLDELSRKIGERVKLKSHAVTRQSGFYRGVVEALIFTSIVAVIGLALFLRKVLQDRKSDYQSLKFLSYRLQRLQEEERLRISREIHDELGQQLTVLKMEAFDFMRNAITAENRDRFADIVKSIDGIIQSVRRVANDLRPLLIEDLGLIPAIEWLVHDFSSRSNVPCQLHNAAPDLHLGKEAGLALFRILQEALTNCARHSGTDRVEVDLWTEEKFVNLRVRDFGTRSDVNLTKRRDSVGIIGMRERASDLGGSFSITNFPGEGTEVKVAIPILGEGNDQSVSS